MKNIYKLTFSTVMICLLLSACAKVDSNSSTNSASNEASELKQENPFKSLITSAAPNAEVFIIEPKDGAVVSSPVKVVFGVRNMTIAKAGDTTEFSGHHHLLINLETLPDMTVPLPATDQIIHFGAAQTETTIELDAGQHSLQLLLGNHAHIPHDKPVLSKKISITVQ